MNEQYFFWTGSGLPKTVVSNWQRSYGKLFKLVALKEPGGQVKRCHPHMFRDTFAVESLLAGMRLEEVSTILGHSSVRITEKHYMPWVRARQASLNQAVMDSWVKQGKVTPAAPTAVPMRLIRIAFWPGAIPPLQNCSKMFWTGARVYGVQLLKFAKLLITLQQRVTLRQFLLQLSISPLRGKLAPYVSTQKIMECAPVLAPEKP